MTDPTIEEQAINVVANEYYRRGFEAAKFAAKRECDDMAKHLQRDLTDETPEEIADTMTDLACVAINLGYAIAALKPEVTQ